MHLPETYVLHSSTPLSSCHCSSRMAHQHEELAEHPHSPRWPGRSVLAAQRSDRKPQTPLQMNITIIEVNNSSMYTVSNSTCTLYYCYMLYIIIYSCCKVDEITCSSDLKHLVFSRYRSQQEGIETRNTRVMANLLCACTSTCTCILPHNVIVRT